MATPNAIIRHLTSGEHFFAELDGEGNAVALSAPLHRWERERIEALTADDLRTHEAADVAPFESEDDARAWTAERICVELDGRSGEEPVIDRNVITWGYGGGTCKLIETPFEEDDELHDPSADSCWELLFIDGSGFRAFRAVLDSTAPDRLDAEQAAQVRRYLKTAPEEAVELVGRLATL